MPALVTTASRRRRSSRRRLRFNGAIKHFVYGNGIVHDMTQNARLLPDTSTDAYGTTKFMSDSIDYDANGNVAAITDGASGRNQRGNRDMSYDPLDRLLTAASPMFGNGASGTASYAYDALDNLTHLSMPATASRAARNWDYCYDEHWRLTNLKTGGCGGATVVGLGYDVQGNLANKNGQSYRFGMNNRLYTATGQEGYRYDAAGRRVLAASPSLGNILSQYAQDGQLLHQQNLRTGTDADYVSLGGSLVAIRESPTAGGTTVVKYQHTDALGTPVAVTDASRSVIERSEYEPFGQLLNRPITDGPGYTGHVQDAQTGLTYMQQRYYDPSIGRFLSVDPVTALSNPVGMFNRYDYGLNNPYKFTDPDGRQSARSICEKNPKWCTAVIQVNPSSGGSIQTTTSQAARPSGPGRVLGMAGSAVAVGGGPEDPAGDVVAIGILGVAAIAGPELIDKMAKELQGISERVQGPQGVQYSLKASVDGWYPNVRGGQTYLQAGDVWKYGQTTGVRYSDLFLKKMRLEFVTEYQGGQVQILMQEKFKIYSYYAVNGQLPPGNKIFR